MRQCNECREAVHERANVCPHCQSRLDSPHILNWMLLGIVGVAGIAWIGSDEGMNSLVALVGSLP